jgi:hypothetical protein
MTYARAHNVSGARAVLATGLRFLSAFVLCTVGTTACVVPATDFDDVDVHFENGCDQPIFAGLGVGPGDLEGLAIPPNFTAVAPGATSEFYSSFDRDDDRDTYYLWVVPEGSQDWGGPPFQLAPDDVEGTADQNQVVLRVSGEWCPAAE